MVFFFSFFFFFFLVRFFWYKLFSSSCQKQQNIFLFWNLKTVSSAFSATEFYKAFSKLDIWASYFGRIFLVVFLQCNFSSVVSFVTVLVAMLIVRAFFASNVGKRVIRRWKKKNKYFLFVWKPVCFIFFLFFLQFCFILSKVFNAQLPFCKCKDAALPRTDTQFTTQTVNHKNFKAYHIVSSFVSSQHHSFFSVFLPSIHPLGLHEFLRAVALSWK